MYGSGYGGGMYGNGMYGGGGMMGPNGEMQPGGISSFAQSTQASFQMIEGLVQAFGGFAQMLESTYMATHSSFFGRCLLFLSPFRATLPSFPHHTNTTFTAEKEKKLTNLFLAQQ